jgi:hypothetical protein
VGPLATHFVVGLYEVSDNTLYWASLYVCYGSSAIFLKIKVGSFDFYLH